MKSEMTTGSQRRRLRRLHYVHSLFTVTVLAFEGPHDQLVVGICSFFSIFIPPLFSPLNSLSFSLPHSSSNSGQCLSTSHFYLFSSNAFPLSLVRSTSWASFFILGFPFSCQDFIFRLYSLLLFHDLKYFCLLDCFELRKLTLSCSF